MVNEFLRKYFFPPFILIVALLGGVIIRIVLSRIISGAVKKSETKLDDIILSVVKGPIVFWALLIGIGLALRFVPVSDYVREWANKLLTSLWVFSLMFLGIGLFGRLLKTYGKKVEMTLPMATLTQNIIKLVVLVVGTLIILQTLGVAITPLIGALGIGSLAVALALQDTLSNLFAGFYIVLSKQIKIGDYIKLDSGEEGYVVDIDWRSTKTRTIFNNIILIPNAKLAQSIVTNYFVYDKKMMLRIPIGVSYESDPEKVEKVLIEEVEKAVGEVNGLLKEPRPFVRFIPGFGDFSLDFTLYCAVREFRDQYHVQHELRKRIFKRFKKEGIEIPFPIRTLYLKKES